MAEDTNVPAEDAQEPDPAEAERIFLVVVDETEVMQEEARQQAEQALQAFAAKVQALTTKVPVLYVREGRRRDELLALIKEEPGISLLVLATATGREGPGPLVTYLVGQLGGQTDIPVTLVPGRLSEAEIDAVT